VRDVWGNGLDWSEALWRYFTAERFAWLMERSSMYFAAATQFRDAFEGAVAVQAPDFPVDPRYAEMEYLESAFYQLKRLTKINCWHRADYESDAMWKLYAGASKGVAICSTPQRMRAAFGPFRLAAEYAEEELSGGAVRYEDLLRVRLNPSMLERFFYKHQAFAWEREFRLAISLRRAEEFGVNVPELGIEVSVDVGALVERIMLGPELSTKEAEMIVSHAEKAGLGKRIAKSSLLGRPRYI
jgi:hypothetical protein